MEFSIQYSPITRYLFMNGPNTLNLKVKTQSVFLLSILRYFNFEARNELWVWV